jgi:hypothetical protein
LAPYAKVAVVANKQPIASRSFKFIGKFPSQCADGVAVQKNVGLW